MLARRGEVAVFYSEQFPEQVSSAVSACSWGANRVDAFWRTPGGQLGHRWWAGGWNAETVGITVHSDPAVCTWGVNRFDVFWREGSNLRHAWFDGAWSATETLATNVASRPAACCWAAGRLDVFWRDPAGALRHRWYEGGWSHEETLATGVASGPAASSWGRGRIAVFYRNAAGALMQVWYQNAWQGPVSLGGTFVDDPAACAWAPGVVDVFVRRSDNTIWHRWFDDGWHEWFQREGLTAATPGVAAWGDGRIDLFHPGTDGRLWHSWYGGQPVATRSAEIKTMWAFLRDYNGPDKIQRLLSSFACGTLNGACSGAMISPHIFMTASHCGGPGWTGGVSFYRINQFALPPDDRSQRLSPAHPAKAFPWQDSGIGSTRVRGDTVLWWVPDGPDGVPPGLKYGYLEVSGLPVPVGTRSYSFWQNPAIRLNTTLLYSDGVAEAKGTDSTWLGQWTRYTTWSVGGASGSSNIVAESPHFHRSVGVTQGGSGGPGRVVADAEEFLREYDTDRNQVLDAIDYDWLITAPVLDFHLLLFDSPFRLSRWVAVPNGSGTSLGDRVGSLSGFPQMTGRADRNRDGFWHNFARFRPSAVYRLSIAARGTQDGTSADQRSYVKFRSDSTGHEVVFRFRPAADTARFVGRVTLSGHSDYRLILGTDAGTTCEVQSLAVIAEGRPFGFGTHDERRSWEFANASRPTSWGTRGEMSFAGAVVGPSTGPWSIRNRFVALLPSTSYRVRFETLAVSGPGRAGACFVRAQDLGGVTVAERRWDFLPGSALRTEEFVFGTGSGAPKVLAFGIDHAAVYLVGDMQIDTATVA